MHFSWVLITSKQTTLLAVWMNCRYLTIHCNQYLFCFQVDGRFLWSNMCMHEVPRIVDLVPNPEQCLLDKYNPVNNHSCMCLLPTRFDSMFDMSLDNSMHIQRKSCYLDMFSLEKSNASPFLKQENTMRLTASCWSTPSDVNVIVSAITSKRRIGIAHGMIKIFRMIGGRHAIIDNACIKVLLAIDLNKEETHVHDSWSYSSRLITMIAYHL